MAFKGFIVKDKNDLLRKSKEIHIPIHNTVSISLMAQMFIDTRFFQRLSELKQLATCSYIFSGATHTRFEHSIGTYYLADKLVSKLRLSTGEEVLDLWTSELIKIAGLCHDIGHGPFSHIFDDVFIKNSPYKEHIMATHEFRSIIIVSKIIEESEVLTKYMCKKDIEFIQSLINPSKDNTGFVYQIVSNNVNGLDVDKYDYINRDAYHIGIKSGFDHMKLIDSAIVIDNNIVYSEQSQINIYNLFQTRYAFHKQVYQHKGVVSASHMIVDIMSQLDEPLGITTSILDIEKFVLMTDNYIIQSMKQSKLPKLIQLNKRLQTHNMYPHIITVVGKSLDNIKEILHEYYDKCIVSVSKMGFVSGDKKDPFENIYVYRTKDYFKYGSSTKVKIIDKSEFIIPEVYQQKVIMVFTEYDDIVDNVRGIFKKIE